MKTYYYILILFTLLTFELKSQENYIIKGYTTGVPIYEDAADNDYYKKYELAPNCSVIRENIKNEVVKYLYEGDDIDVYEKSGDWGKVKATNNLSNEVWGWVNMNALTQKPKIEINFKKDFVEFYNSNPLLFWKWVIGIIIFIGILVLFQRLSQRCKVCGKWGAVYQTDSNKKLDYSVSTTIRKSERLTDIYGKSHTNYYHVPATKRTYDHLDKYVCKYCGDKTEKRYTSSDTSEN